MVDRYDMLSQPWLWREFYGERPGWVFTHRDMPAIPSTDIRFVSGDVRSAHDEMVATVPDSNIWIVGGGELLGQFDDAGLLDEIWLGMKPVFLGAGAPLLPRRLTSKRLTIRTVKRSGDRIRVILDVLANR